MSDTIEMWVVYIRPKDYPEHYVARRWEIHDHGGPTADIRLALSLDEVRAMLPSGLHRMERFPQDDPVIAEVWL